MLTLTDHPLGEALPHLVCEFCKRPLTLTRYGTGSQRLFMNLYYECMNKGCLEYDRPSPSPPSQEIQPLTELILVPE